MADPACTADTQWAGSLLAARTTTRHTVAVLSADGQDCGHFLITDGCGQEMALRFCPGLCAPYRVAHIDGHEPIAGAIEDALESKGTYPLSVTSLAGSGVPFLERRVEWRDIPMTDEQFTIALHPVTDDQER